MTVQSLTISGKRFALVPMRDFEALKKRAAAQSLPRLPDPLTNGNYPAAQTVRVIYARKLIQERESAGLSQSELARRAGLRPETINRLEKGKHSPDTATLPSPGVPAFRPVAKGARQFRH